MSTSIFEIDFNCNLNARHRILKNLWCMNVRTLEQLRQMSDRDYLAQPKAGKRTLAIIRKTLSNRPGKKTGAVDRRIRHRRHEQVVEDRRETLNIRRDVGP